MFFDINKGKNDVLTVFCLKHQIALLKTSI